jgi:hypothetical protein
MSHTDILTWVGVVGFRFERQLKDGSRAVDISEATTVEFLFRDPSGVVKAVLGQLKTTGTDGRIVYTTDADTFDQEGTWTLQPHVITPTLDIHGMPETFLIGAPLAVAAP